MEGAAKCTAVYRTANKEMFVPKWPYISQHLGVEATSVPGRGNNFLPVWQKPGDK